MVTRVMAAGVRLAVPAIPIALILGVPVWVAILVLGGGHGASTRYLGGIKAVIWIDLIQVVIYLSGAALALGFLLHEDPGGLRRRAAAGSRAPVALRTSAADLSSPYTFWAGVIGGGFLAMASHGADQLIVQRLLACRGLARRAEGPRRQRLPRHPAVRAVPDHRRRALRSTSARAGRSARSDEIFPTYIVQHLPPLVSAYLVAGIFSAAMCSESSALNSLASALALDIVGPVFGKERLEGQRGLSAGAAADLLWTVVLAGLAVGFCSMRRASPPCRWRSASPA